MGAYVKLLVKEVTSLGLSRLSLHFSYSCIKGSGYEMGEALSDLVKTWVPASNLLGINLGTNLFYTYNNQKVIVL